MHLTAEQAFESARWPVPEISLATVYNTLNERPCSRLVVRVLLPDLYDPIQDV